MASPPPSPRRSGWSVATLLLAFLALAAAGFALRTSLQSREIAADRARSVELLRSEVDSLRSRLTELTDPFAPTPAPLPDTAAVRPVPSRIPR